MVPATTTDMPLYIKIGGVDTSAICAHAEPHESVVVLLERIEEVLAFVEMPYTKFTAAYSPLHGRATGLREGDPDYTGVQSGCPVTVNKFFTPAARLDPTKAVADYFDTRVDPETASIVLEWPPEAYTLYKIARETARLSAHAMWARINATGNSTSLEPSPLVHEPAPPPPCLMCASPWRFLSSCMRRRLCACGGRMAVAPIRV